MKTFCELFDQTVLSLSFAAAGSTSLCTATGQSSVCIPRQLDRKLPPPDTAMIMACLSALEQSSRHGKPSI
jgi:hypothetical protein